MRTRPVVVATISEADLAVCDKEPIRVPGAVQPHGALLVLDPATLSVLQASANTAAFLGAPEPILGRTPNLGLPLKAVRGWLESGEPSFVRLTQLHGNPFYLAAHRSDGAVVVEFEQAPAADEQSLDSLFPHLQLFTETLGATRGTEALCTLAARHIRQLTGFDRVLAYRFDEDWNGHVLGEDGNGVLPSYLGLRFPASDIPAQARELYKANRLRIIPDASYTPVPLEPDANPLTGRALDMSRSLLRSVSPVHLEYMRNMGTGASMSVSILVEGELWGLISCHSRDPHVVTLNVRNACDFAAQVLATQIAAHHRVTTAAQSVDLNGVQSRLLASMAAADDWRDGLAAAQEDLLAQVGAVGAVIVSGGEQRAVGLTPDASAVAEIVAWLESACSSDLHATAHLSRDMPEAEAWAEVASGLLAVRISELHADWLLWFRPEVITTVRWGGQPHKIVVEGGRIHPRQSFEAWKEQVRANAPPWSSAELAAAAELRAAIVGVVMRKAEELAQLTSQLTRSNKELEAFSYSISHDLRAPFRHIVGYSELLRDREKSLDDKSRHYVEAISEAASSAGRLVDGLLNFSHLGRTSLSPSRVDVTKMVTEIRRSLEAAAPERRIRWEIASLPPAWGDPTLLRQVLMNLIDNAVKYTRPREEAVISVSGEVVGGATVYTVGDNGVGFDMTYAEKMFGVFQRLQREEDFEGTGIGLALARRIVDRHGGRLWGEGEVGRGARFHLALPCSN